VETVSILSATWFLYLIPFIPIAAPVWFFGRRRVRWNRWDFALVLLPFAVWAVLIMNYDTGKSLANLAEAFWLGCAVPVAPVLRLAVGARVPQRLLALGLLVTTCLVAVGLWAFVPGLPE